MKTTTNNAISLALLLVGVQAISGGGVSDRVDTSYVLSNVTTAAPSVVSNLSTNGTQAANVSNSTQTVPMVMEGVNNPPKKSDLKKDSDVKKKTEPEKPVEEKSEDGSFPSKEPAKQSVVARKGVNMAESSANIPAANVSTKVEPVVEESPPKSSTAAPPVVVSPHPEHHPKPNVTLDVPDHETSPRREDYVIPVVGIIFVIPLIVILGALVYKKGVDLWERRHYRPMDFLIDGIYNNQ